MISCLICKENRLEALIKLYRRAGKPRFRQVYICVNCGHIQLNPKENFSDNSKLNAELFSEKYKAGLIEKNNEKKLSKFILRIGNKLNNEGGYVLDIGPGSGFLIYYIREKKYHYYFIEPIKKFEEKLVNIGGHCASNDIYNFNEELKNKFDLIILRHVLEHLSNPLLILKIIEKYLKPDGLLYLAIPNGINFTARKGFRTSFLRDVHLSYFSFMNIKKLASQAGLKILEHKNAGEIYCLFKKGKFDFIWINEYQKNKFFYKQMKIKAIVKDVRNIFFNELFKFIKWIRKIKTVK